MKGTSVHIKNIMELNSSVIIRFKILLWLSGCENFTGPSRNGPQDTVPLNASYTCITAMICGMQLFQSIILTVSSTTRTTETVNLISPTLWSWYIEFNCKI